MHFLTSMCFICLKSKNELNVIKAETLIKLLYCLEKRKYFIPHFNETKMCNDCLDKLDAAFDFKQMCLNNIVQFKKYAAQLKQTCNKSSLFNTYITVDLIDVNKFKETLEVDKSAVLEHEKYSDKQPETELIKEQTLDGIYCESYENNKTPKEYLNKNLNLLLRNQESTEKSFKEELQNESTETSNVYLNEVKQLKITDESEIHSDEQLENTFMKTEILNDIHLQYSNEKLKLLLHKEEILDDVNDEEIIDEEIKNIFRKNSEQDQSQEQHVKIHAKKPYHCVKCQKYFLCKSTLNCHILSHSNERPYSCPVCKKSFNMKSSLTRHVLRHSSEKPYSCSICAKGYTEKKYLINHMLAHFNKKLYSCSICMKNFTYKRSLTRHKFIHTKERPYSCLECKKSFNRKSTLRTHIRVVHSSERPYSCSICRKSFKLKCNFKLHTITHTKERPHTCSVCSKRFTQRSSLTQHMRIHSNERPHTCSVCSKSFTQRGTLKRHAITHFNEGLYPCSTCKTSFNRKSTLISDMLTHSNESPYQCFKCKIRFNYKNILTRQMLMNTNTSTFI